VPFTAAWRGHERLFKLLGPPSDTLVAMEATAALGGDGADKLC
jgi:hypothetical protein